jgi:hypothetical protein
MSDLDVSRSLHVDKMEELSKELTNGCVVRLEKLVRRTQVWNLPPCETIRAVAAEMFADGTINWGRIVTLYTFVRLVVKSIRESGQHSYDFILRTKMTIASELYQYMDLHLRSWIAANGGWVS